MLVLRQEIVFVFTGENQEQVRIGSAYDPRHEARIWLQAQDSTKNFLDAGKNSAILGATINTFLS